MAAGTVGKFFAVRSNWSNRRFSQFDWSNRCPRADRSLPDSARTVEDFEYRQSEATVQSGAQTLGGLSADAMARDFVFPYGIRSLFHHNGSGRKNLPTKGLAQQAKSHWKRCQLAVNLFLTRPSKNAEDVRPAVTDDSAMNVRAGPDAHWSPTYLIRLAQPALSGNAFEDFVRENTDENH